MGANRLDAAMEDADVVIVNDDRRRVAQIVGLSRRTHRILWKNIAAALDIKSVFLIWAVFGDVGASLLVVAHGLLLLGWRASPSGPQS